MQIFWRHFILIFFFFFKSGSSQFFSILSFLSASVQVPFLCALCSHFSFRIFPFSHQTTYCRQKNVSAFNEVNIFLKPAATNVLCFAVPEVSHQTAATVRISICIFPLTNAGKLKRKNGKKQPNWVDVVIRFILHLRPRVLISFVFLGRIAKTL